MADYDPDNVFAKILSGEFPCHKVHEDEDTLVIMDIMPRGDGHALVIPKAPSRNILDIRPKELAALYGMVQRVARAAMTAFEADGITIQQFNEPAGGQVVFHSHVHVIPRHQGIPLKPHTGERADDAVLAAQAESLRAALGE